MRGQFGQLPCKSDIAPLSWGFWENYPNYPNCPAQSMDIGASRAGSTFRYQPGFFSAHQWRRLRPPSFPRKFVASLKYFYYA